ncbi:MAG: hypothetical protein MHMPM18_001264 [Marteilia pararefringens]
MSDSSTNNPAGSEEQRQIKALWDYLAKKDREIITLKNAHCGLMNAQNRQSQAHDALVNDYNGHKCKMMELANLISDLFSKVIALVNSNNGHIHNIKTIIAAFNEFVNAHNEHINAYNRHINDDTRHIRREQEDKRGNPSEEEEDMQESENIENSEI